MVADRSLVDIAVAAMLAVALPGERGEPWLTRTNTLPEMARNADSGDDMCGGIGVDDAAACVMETLFP